MPEKLRLMCVLAHPDDESLGNGGILARYSAEGVETYVVTATRGERGWMGDADSYPGLAALGEIREAELRAACRELGVYDVQLLDYIDGDLDKADPKEAIGLIAAHIRRVRPHVVATFDPAGAYGHPDHIAICQFTTAALVCAADASYTECGEGNPHRVAKLYYMAGTKQLFDLYQTVFGDLVMHIDGVERRSAPWEGWAVTTRVSTGSYMDTVWNAVLCHESQMPAYSLLENLSAEQQKTLWSSQTYYRVYSTVNGGRELESDLFEGLR